MLNRRNGLALGPAEHTLRQITDHVVLSPIRATSIQQPHWLILLLPTPSTLTLIYLGVIRKSDLFRCKSVYVFCGQSMLRLSLSVGARNLLLDWG